MNAITDHSRSDGLENLPAFDDRWDSFDHADIQALNIVLPTLGFRADDNGLYFARALDYVKARTYMRLLPTLSGERLVPVSEDTPSSAMSVSYRIYDEVGMAKIISNYADDLPRADVRAREQSVPVRSIGDSYGYTQQDLRASLATGSNLPGRKADAARISVVRKENSLMIRGDTEFGMYGISNHPNIPTIAVTARISNGTATGDQILADFTSLLNTVINQSNGIHVPNVLAMTNAVRAYLFTKRTSWSQPEIAGVALQKAFPDIEIVVAQELKGLGGAGTDIVIAAQRDLDNFYYDRAMPFTQHPPQARNLEMVVPCEARAAGFILVRPLSICTMTGA
jgi:hypothetical protein